MVLLLDLANELLDQITDHVRVEDIEAWSLCCRRINILSTSALTLHRHRKQAYSFLVLGKPFNENELYMKADHAAVFLRKIIEDPSAAQYTKNVCVGRSVITFSDWWYDSVPKSSVQDQISAGQDALNDHRDYIIPAMESSPYLNGMKSRDNWLNETYAGREDMLIAWMLTLLPNIEYLSISHGNDGIEPLFNVVSTVCSKCSAFPSSVVSKQPFSRLKHVDMEPIHDYEHINFGSLQQLAALPSVETLSGKSIWGRGGCWYQIPAGPALSEINILRGSIDPDAFATLLSGVKALHHFEYIHSENREELLDTESLDFAEILLSLVHYARHSLVSLELRTIDTGCWCKLPWSRSKHPINPTPPRELLALKTLSVDYDFIVDVAIDITGSEVSPCHRFVDFLPSSLESLHIYSANHEARTVERLFEGLVELRKSRIPMLKSIVFHDIGAEMLAWRAKLSSLAADVCTPIGIDLRFVK